MPFVLADKNIFGLETMLKSAGFEYKLYDEASFSPNMLRGVDAWILRTVTKVDRHLITKANCLQYIFSASAGTDHIDKQALKEKGIEFGYAKGSNAQAVAEYSLFALLKIMNKAEISAQEVNVGIVGVGAVGSSLQSLLQTVGITYQLYDPPRSLRDAAFTSCSLADLETCNILSFHTPLEKNSSYPTFHLFEEVDGFWASKQLGIINAARGGVVDEKLQLSRMETGLLDYLVLDVWENEPEYNISVRKKCLLATPHIAGYSFEAKLKASFMAVEFLAKRLGGKSIGHFEGWVQRFSRDTEECDDANMHSLWKKLHKAEHYHDLLKKLDSHNLEQRKQAFQSIRKQTALRREWVYQKLDEALYTAFPLMRML